MTTAAIVRATLQEKPNHEVGALLPLLESICKSMRQLLGFLLAELDVAVGQDQFLLSFENDEPVIMSDVASRMSIRPSTVSKMADRLESKGWVKRSSDDGDARRVLLCLTKSGWRTRDAVKAAETEMEVELVKAINVKPQTIAALAELDAALTKRLRRLR